MAGLFRALYATIASFTVKSFLCQLWTLANPKKKGTEQPPRAQKKSGVSYFDTAANKSDFISA